MSTLKTHNLQSPDSGSVNIAMTPNAGMIVSGISTFTGAIDANGDLDVDGHTNLDNVSIAGVTTFSGVVKIPTVVGTNTNANLNVLFQTASGVIDGGSQLTYNPGGDSLSVNGNFININTFRGAGSLGRLTCANHSSTTTVDVSNTVDITTVDNTTGAFTVKEGSNEYITVDTTNSSELIKFGTAGNERLRITSTGDFIFNNNGGDNRIVRNTTSGGPYLLFHNRGIDTTDSSGVYNMGGISAAGYRDVANPSIVGSIQFERQPTAGGASSGCNIVFRTGFNGTTSHTHHSEKLRLTYEGHLLPGANNQYDLGSTAKGWRNVYMNDLNLSNMKGDTNDVDGTQGSWTIQEGKDDLYIINRLNGKKFKIKMEEIS